MTNKTLIFKKVPDGFPVPGQDLVVEDRGFDASAAPPQGGLTLSILYASFDPYMRGRMRPADIESYSPAFPLDGALTNDCVAKVLRSDHAEYQADDLILAHLPIAEFASLPRDRLGLVKGKLHNPHGLADLGLFLGPLGMPGLTAWSSLFEIGQPKERETMFVSAASGAVGQVVAQVAKREGLRVLGSVGSNAKLDFIIHELGFDGGFNYKLEDPAAALARLAPDGIDIYFDNVGGLQLDAAIEAINVRGRIIACGMYNLRPEERYGIKNLMHIVAKRLTVRGFIVTDEDFGPRHAREQQEKMQQWLADGSFKAKLSVTDGIDGAPEALVGMLRGDNFGKAVLKIKGE